MKKRLSLADRHAIKEGIKDIEDSKIYRTKAGKALFEGLTRVREDVRVQLGLGESDLKVAIETGNWKMALWIAVGIASNDEVSEKLSDVLVELYKRECKGKSVDEKIEQWTKYAQEVYDGAINIYVKKGTIEGDYGELFVEAIDLAASKIWEMEFKNDVIVR